MTDNELKKWFWNKFNSCYYVKHENYPESLFMFYDKDFIRKSKFKILQGGEIEYPTKPSGICLFEQDYKNGWLNCNYIHIWEFFVSNTNYKYQEIRDLIKCWLEEETKLNVLTPSLPIKTLEYDTKLKVLTPNYVMKQLILSLEEESKLKIWKQY